MFDSRQGLVLCLILLASVTARHATQEGKEEHKERNKHESHNSRLSRQITPFYNFGYDQQPQEKYEHKSNQDVQRETLNLLKDIAANLNQQQSRPPQYNYPIYPQYPQPPPPPYYPYGPQGHDQILQSKILSLLDDISLQLKQQQAPPSTPQIIYVPYPFVQPKCECNCENGTGTGTISLDKRFKPEDPRQVWGKTEPIVTDDGLQSAFRPVSFDVIPPSRPFTRSTPAQQRGSKQVTED